MPIGEADDTGALVRSVLLAIHEQRASGDITDEQASAAVERLKAALDDPEELRRLLDEEGE
jgi:methionyl-tRNA formyltransferase